MSAKIFICAGEPSGDLHGGKLIEALLAQRPNLKIVAIGGDAMAAAGAQLVVHIRETAFMGFIEVLRHWRQILALWRRTMAVLDTQRPQLVVTIDYPGFNLRLAKAAYRRGIPVVYYISPQIWAWHQSRVKKIKKYVREVLCILPFEVDWYRRHGVRAQFVGHPLLDQPAANNASPSHYGQTRPLIGLLPGSRRQEVVQNLPIMLAAVESLQRRFPQMQTVIAAAPSLELEFIKQIVGTQPVQIAINQNRALMASADLLLIASGTATLEATLHHTPYIVIYRINPISYLFARSMVKVNSITLANLITGKKGVTELVQHQANPLRIASEARRILTDHAYNAQLRQFLVEAHRQLGTPGASQRAARLILKYLSDVS